jgi:glucose/arabinose dehydrogenase
MARIGIGVAILLAISIGACQLLPERYAVNAPIAHILFGRGIDAPPPEKVTSRMRVPAGFDLKLWAEGVDGARFLRFSEAGDLLVTTPRRGRVELLQADRDGDGVSDGRRTLLDGLDRPHGLDLHDGWLYVAESGGFGRVAYVQHEPAGFELEGDFERLVTNLPSGGNHWSRTLRFGPDGWIYVSVGSSCNVCLEDQPTRRAAILRFQPDGSGEETFATGLRNSVGFDWRPGNGDLYATDNGRDLLGDDFPPGEFNRIEYGGFYGWPHANGDRVPDPDLGEGYEDRIRTSIPPAYAFAAHNAPLGMTFVRGDRAPKTYKGAALVALHGSWNRTRKDGYKVVALRWNDDGRIEQTDFLTGFLVDEDVSGRPVDVAEGPDGAFYVSDDYAGAIWRVSHAEP